MNCSSAFGTQHATTSSVQVSSKVVSSVTAEGAKVPSVAVSATGFKDAFSAASEAANAHKAQSTPKQADEKKTTREKQTAKDTATPALTLPATNAALPVSVAGVVPSLPSGTGPGDTKDSSASGTRNDAAAASVSGVSTGDKVDASTSAGGSNASDTALDAASLGNTSGTGDVGGKNEAAVARQDVGLARMSASGSGSDASVDAGDDAAAPAKGDKTASTDSSQAQAATQAGPGAQTVLATQVDPAIQSLLASQGGAATQVQETTQADGAAQPQAATQPDGANQTSTAATMLPTTAPIASQSLIPPTESALKPQGAQTANPLDNALSTGATLKSGGSKSTLASGKDHTTSSDVRGKEKSDDGGSQSSGTSADQSLIVKAAGVVANMDHQSANSHAGSSTGDAVQQAMQSASANAAPSNLSSSLTSGTAGSAAADTPAAASPQAANATPAAELPTLNSAHLIQSMGQSEMKLGMHSAEFGSISINTSLTHQALSAQISISHAGLGQALAAHLPSIEEKLGSAYGLQARVEVRDSSGSSSSADSGRQSQDGRQGQSSGSSMIPSASGIATIASPRIASTSLLAGSSRLDIRI